MGDKLTFANRVIGRMYRREVCSKFVLYIVGAVILLAILIIIYFKFLK